MTAERFCPVCKSLNPIGALRCVACQASLESAPPPITTTPVVSDQPELIAKPSAHLQQLAQLPPDALALFVMGHEQPLIIRNTEQIILGRSGAAATETICDLTQYGAADLGVSRMHALITLGPEGCTVIDLGSTNGTWINDRRLTPHKPFVLQSGDRLRLGNLRLYPYLRATTSAEADSEEIVHLVEGPQTSARFHPRITAHYLNEVLGPYLQALSDLQSVIDGSRGKAPRDVGINTLSAMRQDLPIGVSLNGASDAIRLLKTLIRAWRAEQAEALVELHGARHLPAELEGAAAPMSLNLTEQLDPNITRLMRVSDGLEPGGPRLNPDMQVALLALARQVLANVSPQPEEADRPGLINKLMPPLTLLAIARLEISSDRALGNAKAER